MRWRLWVVGVRSNQVPPRDDVHSVLCSLTFFQVFVAFQQQHSSGQSIATTTTVSYTAVVVVVRLERFSTQLFQNQCQCTHTLTQSFGRKKNSHHGEPNLALEVLVCVPSLQVEMSVLTPLGGYRWVVLNEYFVFKPLEKVLACRCSGLVEAALPDCCSFPQREVDDRSHARSCEVAFWVGTLPSGDHRERDLCTKLSCLSLRSPSCLCDTQLVAP